MRLLLLSFAALLWFAGCSSKPAPQQPDWERIHNDAQKAHRELDAQ